MKSWDGKCEHPTTIDCVSNTHRPFRYAATHSLRIFLVQYEPHEVEAREQGSGQVDVLRGAELHIIASHGWVGCSQDCGACVQRGGDASLGNAHRLLLHHLRTSVTTSQQPQPQVSSMNLRSNIALVERLGSSGVPHGIGNTLLFRACNSTALHAQDSHTAQHAPAMLTGVSLPDGSKTRQISHTFVYLSSRQYHRNLSWYCLVYSSGIS